MSESSENSKEANQPVEERVLESLDPTCNELRKAYDTCFNAWFTGSFLKGEHKGNATPCDELLQIYSACVKTALQAKNIELDGHPEIASQSPMGSTGKS